VGNTVTLRKRLFAIGLLLTLAPVALAQAQPVLHVPLDQSGFQNYFANQVTPYAQGSDITVDTPYVLRITSPVNKQWIEFPIARIHEVCLFDPKGCDANGAVYLRKVLSMLPSALEARDKRIEHDNSLEVLRYGSPSAVQALPPTGPSPGSEDIPTDKDAFTKYYADALSKALPTFEIAVTSQLQITVKPPGRVTQTDDIDSLYALCAHDKFQCGDGFATWLRLDAIGRWERK
jgi:hypothetical protein